MAAPITVQVDGRSLSLTHLERPLFPDGFTKGELISYYQEVAPALLPHLAGRAITRVRFPQGTAAEPFYEKNIPSGAPDWVRGIDVASSTGSVKYLRVEDRPTLAWLGNLAAIELHAPQWRIADAVEAATGIELEGTNEPRARTLLVDLDPGAGVTTGASATAAILAATELAHLGLEAQVKSSGNKGLQLSVPIAATPCSQVHAWARSFAGHLARTHPKVFVATMAKSARVGLVYVDYGQNLAARNTICPYSVRGVEVPSVATPLTWEEVGALTKSSTALRFSPAQVLTRMESHGDVWQAQLETDPAPALPPLAA